MGGSANSSHDNLECGDLHNKLKRSWSDHNKFKISDVGLQSKLDRLSIAKAKPKSGIH